mmetsp:Transcript_100597/g.280218  ORF Transcript_100597/g.280218 Transcript_100597/m.280218 type:complete len:142 (+) Transcript_100597:104-529(+)
MFCFCCDDGAEKNSEVIGETTAPARAVVSSVAASAAATTKEEPAAEPAPAEKPVEPTPAGFCIVFKQGAEEKPCYFQRKPLGFKFLQKTPILVTKVEAGSHAEEVGVAVGMEIAAIGGEPVGAKSYEELWGEIRTGAGALS